MRPTLPIILLLAALMAGCNLLYKPEVRQGTPLTPEMIAGLKSGMTKRQVRLLLGTPPVNDVFHPDRWDYFYTTARSGEPITPPPHLTLYFKNDALVAAEGELAPAAIGKPADATGNTAAPDKNGNATAP
jgi:outer membrane protein assembly factor BamE